MLVLCLLPFWVSEMVRTLGWLILLRETGVVSRVLQATGLANQPVELLYHDATILVGLVYASLLFMVIPLVNSLERHGRQPDRSRLRPRRQAPPTSCVASSIPHAAPGIAAGSIVVFMLCLGNYLTPTLLGGKDSLWFTEQIYTQFITPLQLEPGRGLRLPAAVPVQPAGVGGSETHRSAVRCRDESIMIPSLPRPPRSSATAWGPSSACSSSSCSCRWWWSRCLRSTTPTTRRRPGWASPSTGSPRTPTHAPACCTTAS